MCEAVISDKAVKVRDPHLNPSPESRPKPSEAGLSTVFFRDNFRAEVDSDVISGVSVDLVGMAVKIKFPDCRT